MKKLLLAALAFMGLAAPVEAVLPVEGKAYLLKHQQSGLYLNTEIDGRGDNSGRHCASLESRENASVIYFVANPDSETQWQLRTDSPEGGVLGSTTAWVSVINYGSDYYWTLTEQEDSTVVLSRQANPMTSGNVLAPDATTQGSPLYSNKNGGNASVVTSAKWELVEDPSCYVTFTWPAYNGVTITKKVELAAGANAAANVPAVEFFTPTSIATPNGAIISYTNKAFTINGTWDFPIAANHVYRMKLKPSVAARKYLWFDGTNALNSYSAVDENSFDVNLLWYFTEGEMTAEGKLPLTIHSLGMADGMGLQFGTGDNAVGTLSETPTVWYLEKTNQAEAGQADFTLRHSEANVSYVNDRAGYLSTWASSAGKNDPGSLMRAFELLDSDWAAIAEGTATAEEIAAAKENPTVEAVRGVLAGLSVPDADVDAVIAAGDYIINTLALGNDEDHAAWADAKAAVVRPMDPVSYAALKTSYELLLTNASLHLPAEGKHVMFRHPQNQQLMGVTNGNIQRGGAEGTTTFTLKPANGGFTIFNEYAGGYLKHPTAVNANVTTVQNETEATVYVLDRESVAPAADVTTYNYGLKNVAGGTYPYLHSNGGSNVVMWLQGRQSSWYVEPSDAETAANEYLAGAKEHFAGLTFGTGMGQYGITDAGKAAADAANAVGSDASVADKRAAGNTLRNPETALNMPKVGHIYSFAKADGTKHMSCDTISDHRATMVERTDANLLSTLFYYDEDHHLVSLKNGKVLGRFNSTDNKNQANHSWRTVLLEETDKVGIYTFGEASEAGLYTIMAQGNRYIYNANADVDAGSSPGNSGYFWTIEERNEWIPVAGTETNRTTLCLAVPMQIKPGMSVYTAKVPGNTVRKVVPVPFEGNVIPANTPVIVDFADDFYDRNGENHLVYLHKADVNPVVEGNELQGSIYAFNRNGAAIAVRSGDNFANADTTLIVGGQAYLNGDVTYTAYVPSIEAELDALVGKVFTIKNSDVSNNRGYLIYNPDTDAIWTSGKGGLYNNAAADEAAPTNVNFHWTLLQDNGRRYLYNLGAQKFAAAYVLKGNNGGHAEFVWSFSDYPTAVDFHFFDYEVAEDLASATFNIIGGENVGNNRPGGMMIINGNATHPVPAVSGNSPNDGCGFTLSIVDGVEAGEVASVSEALAAMEAEHSVAADYVADYDDMVNETPGHYNAEGYAAFSAALANAAADAQSKYYALTRARNAAAGNINTFVSGDAYRLTNANGDALVAKIEWIEARYILSTGIADGSEDDDDLNWLCTIDEEGNIVFTRGFEVPEKTWPYEGRANVRARIAEGNKVATHALNEAAAATYDGLGNITLGSLALKSSASLGSDAQTTGISEITAAAASATAAYDLQGRRVNGSAKGLIIVNGQKTLRK